MNAFEGSEKEDEAGQLQQITQAGQLNQHGGLKKRVIKEEKIGQALGSQMNLSLNLSTAICTSHLISLSLSFLTHKMWVMLAALSEECDRLEHLYQVHSTLAGT